MSVSVGLGAEPLYLVDDRLSLLVTEITYKQLVHHDVREVPLEHGVYAGAKVAYAPIQDYLGQRAQVTLFQTQPGEIQVGLSDIDSATRRGKLEVTVLAGFTRALSADEEVAS